MMELYLIVVFPFLLLLALVYVADKYNSFMENNKSLSEINFDFKTVFDFMPWRIKKALANNEHLESVLIEAYIKVHKKLFWGFVMYVILWIAYIVVIVVKFILLFSYQINSLTSAEFGINLLQLVAGALEIFYFLLIPLFEKLNWQKPVRFGILVLQSAKNIVCKANDIIIKALKYVLLPVGLCIPLYHYITFVKEILVRSSVEMTVWIMIIVLAIYQYLVLNIVSRFLSRVGQFIIKRHQKVQILSPYVHQDILFPMLKNYTYLCMVFLYAYASHTDNANTPLAIAMCILFLIDTFLDKDRMLEASIAQRENKKEISSISALDEDNRLNN